MASTGTSIRRSSGPARNVRRARMPATARKISTESTSRTGRITSWTTAGVVCPSAKALGGQSMPQLDHGEGTG